MVQDKTGILKKFGQLQSQFDALRGELERVLTPQDDDDRLRGPGAAGVGDELQNEVSSDESN